MEAEITPDPQSKIVLFLNHYKFKIEPDAVLPCEPREDEGTAPVAGVPPIAPTATSETALTLNTGQEESPDAGPMMATMAAACIKERIAASSEGVDGEAVLDCRKSLQIVACAAEIIEVRMT